MSALLVALLILVPSPKQAPPPVNPLVGAWSLDWTEHCIQTTFLYADGSCYSPQFGTGKWSVDNDGFIWFSEQGDTAQYVMWFDLDTGIGSGWHVYPDGEIHGGHEIRIRRGERLMMPRVFE